MSQTSVTLRNPNKAAFLAWLVPGLGHFYQGRTGKGILYAVCILGLYLVGMAMGEGKIVYWRWVNPLNNPEKFCLYYLGQFFVGLPALPALIQGTLHHYGMGPDPLGLHGRAVAERPQWPADPAGQARRDRLDLHRIAGLLNILAIYDAYEGPAYQDEEEPAGRHATDVVAGASVGAHGLTAGSRHDAVIRAHLLAHPAAGRRDQPGLLGLAARGLATDLVALRSGCASGSWASSSPRPPCCC